MSTASIRVPDLLRRFAPAPHCVSAVIGDIELELHTNDATLSAALQRAGTPSRSGESAVSLDLKVIRDCDAPSGGSDVTVLSAWPLTMLLMGAGTMLVMDSERREILSFLAPAITADRFVHELLPMLLEYLQSGTAFIAPSQPSDLP
jgi:hypothetical protein